MSRQVASVDVDHLVSEHGIDKRVLTTQTPNTRAAQRNLALYFEMRHAADHAQRRVGHEHG